MVLLAGRLPITIQNISSSIYSVNQEREKEKSNCTEQDDVCSLEPVEKVVRLGIR